MCSKKICYCLAPKIVQKQQQKQFCDHICANRCIFFINTGTMHCNAMSNDDLIIEIIDQSHGISV